MTKPNPTQAMKLTSAEEIADKLFGAHSFTQAERFTQLQEIRQIQANALRWAAETANEHESFISRGYVESLEDKASQLDPLPEAKVTESTVGNPDGSKWVNKTD